MYVYMVWFCVVICDSTPSEQCVFLFADRCWQNCAGLLEACLSVRIPECGEQIGYYRTCYGYRLFSIGPIVS
jgi:hypothetical protein